MKIDYLIIGQGLAGSLLAWELIQRGKKIVIVDNNQQNASLVAAGLINPVTGMRFVKSTHVDHQLPIALRYYQKLSHFFKQTFYIEKPLLRCLRHKKEQLTAQKRLQQSEYQAYLSHITPVTDSINSPYGLLEQQQTGYLLTQPLLLALKNYFIAHNSYQIAELHYSDITLQPYLTWKNMQPQQIIFCEGYQATHNPWFSYLPFQLVKGEIITAQSHQSIQPHILNYGHWFIPLNQHQFRIGATFDRENLSTKITHIAKETLLQSLNTVYPSLTNITVTQQLAGIRPTTLDKQPFIGHHPHYQQLAIFNGFGAKGSLQIPYYCQNFVNYLLKHQLIPDSSHILRYNHQIR